MPAPDLPPPPARMLVNADEFFLNGSRRAGPSGSWRIQLQNNGEDDHDLAVRRADGRILVTMPIVHPRANNTVAIRLKPGTYTLFCTIADHETLGMSTRLTVRTPKVRTTAP